MHNKTMLIKNVRAIKNQSSTYRCTPYKYKGKWYNKISVDDNATSSDIYLPDDQDTFIGTIDGNSISLINNKQNILHLE